ncbi:MAG TPA: polyprenyl synthetase family protein [Polyangiaceae bacterium]|nr:polyprenyl synthetase family protein [Polyangiaceae bacterium]
MTTNHAFALEAPCTLVTLLSEEFDDRQLAKTLGHEHRVPAHLWDAALVGPLLDFLGRPGKEFRARLVVLGWQLSGRNQAPPAELPLIVEALHSGSLIVDDIEDQSNQRRGGPALHCRYGVPRALNAGNFLYFWALELLSRLALPPITELALHRAFSRTLLACHQGQALDLSVAVSELAQSEVLPTVSAVTQLKTGKLCELAAQMGALAAGASQSKAQAIAHFGRELGIGLQMLDDLGGIVSERRAHKGHEDLRHGRPTWPWAWAAQYLDARAYAKIQNLGRAVATSGEHPEHLASQLRSAVASRGRAEAHERLAAALARLAEAVPEPRALLELEHELARLEKSYD